MNALRSYDLESDNDIVSFLRENSYSLTAIKDLQPLIERIGDARIVMLGEASHGTHEYYTWRSHISKTLIKEKGFNFIAVEGDWPDCYEINRFIKGMHPDAHAAVNVLRSFDRWPSWMWGNWEVAALAEWLKIHNLALRSGSKAGFYGLDVYSLWDSMDVIIGYLEKTDPAAAEVAREAYRCFEPHRSDEGQSYVRALQFVPDTCEDEVLDLLRKIRERRAIQENEEETFSLEQNALIAVNAEKYYRSMLSGSSESWNVRDRHMMETLERLMDLHGEGSRAIVWEHNTHIGDARATDMSHEGMINIGQLARETYGEDQVVLVGFGSYEGTVIAGASWGAEMKVMDVPPSRRGSWEYYLHMCSPENRLLVMNNFQSRTFLERYFDHRAIGVVYRPMYEKYGNYVPSILPVRYDAFIYIDKTKALHPLNMPLRSGRVPDTYPFGV
jgi:erythromycin esterase